MTGRELDREVRAELRSLPPGAATDVSRHLVMAGRLLDEDPELAYEHALVARRRAPRLAVVREAAGVAAHATGRWAEALAELRTHARMTGSSQHLPLLADCERGLGRPDRALALAGRPEVAGLDVASRIEMRIVAAGARADLGQDDAAVVTLQCPELASRAHQPWVARLRYAYADALLRTDRRDEARVWFGRALEADPDGLTDAADRCADLDGIVFDVEAEGAQTDADVEAEGADVNGGEAEGDAQAPPGDAAGGVGGEPD